MKITKKRRIKTGQIIIYIGLAVFLVLALFPIYWMLNTSLKTSSEIYSKVPTFFPQNISFDEYAHLLFKTTFLRSLLNSMVIALGVSVVTIFVCMIASYSIARLKVKGKRIMSRSVLYTYLMPRTLLFIPLYMLAVQIGINNSVIGLALIYPTFTIPYAMWMLIAYFKTVPAEIEEAAMIDGCGPLRTMFRIFFPMVIPGIISTMIFCFTLCWNEYLYSLIMISESAAKTFPVMLSELMVDDVYAWGALMAGSVISCLPIIAIYAFASKNVTGGLTAGSVKG
jgi:multiple sugar transport system permease protein